MAKPTAADFDRMFGSKFLSKDDVGEERIKTVINDITLEQVREKDGATKNKFVVHFDDLDKALVLNNTNANTLKDALGKEASHWIGARVIIYVDNSVVFNNILGGVRLQVLTPKTTKKSGPASTDPDMMNDAIQF